MDTTRTGLRQPRRIRTVIAGTIAVAALAVPCAILVAAVNDGPPTPDHRTYSPPVEGLAEIQAAWWAAAQLPSTSDLTDVNGAVWAACTPVPASTIGLTEMNGAFWAAWLFPGAP
jgi:hypothetical protein